MTPETSKEIVEQIKSLREEVQLFGIQFETHAAADTAFQKKMEPMLKIFEDNNIVKMRFSKDLKTIIFVAGGITSIAAAGYVIKLFILKLFSI